MFYFMNTPRIKNIITVNEDRYNKCKFKLIACSLQKDSERKAPSEARNITIKQNSRLGFIESIHEL